MSLPELIVSMGIFSLLVLAFIAILNLGLRSWVNMEGRHLGERDLRQAEFSLLRDLKATRADNVVCGTLSNGDGGLLWMNSTLRRGGLLDGQACRDTDGEPIWQATIVYYLVRPAPALHQQLYGYQCPPWAGGGVDPLCPHKLLIRRLIETQAHTAVPAVKTESEPFPANVNAWVGNPVVQPSDMKLSNLPNPGSVIESKIVALTMLSFIPLRPSASLDRVDLHLATVRRQEAEKHLAVGSYDFSLPGNRRFVLEYNSGAFPGI